MLLVVVPPMINLDHLKPNFERAILSQTDIPAKINGHINISLLGRISIKAHNVSVPNGSIDSVLFAIPLSKIFDINTATLDEKITISGARLDIGDLTAPKIGAGIEIRNALVNFMDRDYRIITGALKNGSFAGTVRTEQHKYSIETRGDQFSVLNKNEGLSIRGRLNQGGGAHAILSIDTNNINAWFDFFEPKINQHVALTMEVDWDGGYGFRFQDIHGTVGEDNFTGSIDLPDGDAARTIRFASDNIDFDLSFLLTGRSFLMGANLDLDLGGNIKFMNTVYRHVRLAATGQGDKIIIDNLEFENDSIKGSLAGEITADGAHNLALRFLRGNAEIYCLFNGTPEVWQCDEYEYSDKNLFARGTLAVKGDSFAAALQSPDAMPENFDFARNLSFLGNNGTVSFEFANALGQITIKNKKQRIDYTAVQGKSLDWLGAGFEFLPAKMRDAVGRITWDGKDISFVPTGERWELTMQGNFFFLSGISAKEFLTAFYPTLELGFANDFPYHMSGTYSKPNIRDLEIHIADHIFRGSANASNITLRTETLDLDMFANRGYFDNYEKMQFLAAAPITTPFSLGGASISLSAPSIIMNGEEYNNFVYSVRGNTQDFSITDDARGSLLVSLKRRSTNTYDILLKLNRFAFSGPLLAAASPLNISDSVVTGQAQLMTGGRIAYDFWNNLKGAVDLSFDGGILNGIGTDAFYARAADITRTTAEDAIAHAVSGGNTRIKSFRLSGEYENGDFQTTRRFLLNARNTEMSGHLQLIDGILTAQIGILLRGTSIEPRPISLTILKSGMRSYSLSEMMRVFDPEYLAEFVKM